MVIVPHFHSGGIRIERFIKRSICRTVQCLFNSIQRDARFSTFFSNPSTKHLWCSLPNTLELNSSSCPTSKWKLRMYAEATFFVYASANLRNRSTRNWTFTRVENVVIKNLLIKTLRLFLERGFVWVQFSHPCKSKANTQTRINLEELIRERSKQGMRIYFSPA